MLARATRIDIEEELEAIKRGECGHCRIGATHPINKCCRDTPAFVKLVVCPEKHVYNPMFFTGCPLCNDPEEVII